MKPRGRLHQSLRNRVARMGFGAFILFWLVGALHGAIHQPQGQARRTHQ